MPSCAEGGVLGILPGLVGVIQATEAIKLILGKGESLVGRLLLVDALNMRFRELKLRKNPECPVCGANPTVTKLIDYQQFCGIVPETKEEKALKNGIPQLTVKELKRRMDAGEDVFILDVREPYEYQIANIGGKLIPQNDVPQRLAEIDRDREIVVQCRSGARSQRIAEFLVAGRLSRTSRIWQAASWPGPTRSTRRCRSTEHAQRSIELREPWRGSRNVCPANMSAWSRWRQRHLDGLVAAAAVDPSLYQWSAVPAGQRRRPRATLRLRLPGAMQERRCPSPRFALRTAW